MTRLLAPAKLTLHLAVTGVRADGYHELRSEMVSLSLADELVFTEGGDQLTVAAEPDTRAELLGDPARNLVTRALAAVGRRASVRLDKRIPLGGGLGGGSTDAAAVLRWAGCTDLEVALALGSDVPFSVVGGRALVEGTGEQVTPLPFERRRFVLLIPPFGVATSKVYAAWDALAERDQSGQDGNALTTAAIRVEPRLVPWRDALEERTGRRPVLAGSGSTWFVEEGAVEAGTEHTWLVQGDERARLVRVHTVPAGWDGT
jgi:4-diphosphocytidyl-2-C-methyl-D-erythritol kinase